MQRVAEWADDGEVRVACELCHQWVLGAGPWCDLYLSEKPDDGVCAAAQLQDPVVQICNHRYTTGLRADDTVYCFDCGWTFCADG